MDDSEPSLKRGGAVEPANRAVVAKARFQTPPVSAGQHYEHRDPFADVTYRARTFDEMAAKADQLGASRFYEVGEDDKRTPIRKVDGQWQRGDSRSHEAPSPAAADSIHHIASTPIGPSNKPVQADLARVDADAERAARAEQLLAALTERYVIKRAAVGLGAATLGQTEYRFRGDATKVAFTETTFRLATDTNSPSIARSMVDVAQARNWQALRVSGHEDFKRLVWLEASVRGVKTLGYEPQPGDIELLKRERESRQVNRIEPAEATRAANATEAIAIGTRSGRGGGRKAVLAALDAVLVAKRVPEKQRQAVMAAASESLAKRLAAGQAHKVKVFDKAAAPQRPEIRPLPEQQRARERAAPTR